MSIEYRIVLALTIASIAFAITYYWTRTNPPTSGMAATISLSELVTAVKGSLKKLIDTPGEQLGLELEDIALVVHVQNELRTSAQADLQVPVFDEASVSSQTQLSLEGSSTVTVKLVPPTGTVVMSDAMASSALDLTNLLLGVRDSLHKSVTGQPTLDVKSVKVELSFILTQGLEQDAKLQVLLLNLEATNAIVRSSRNSLVLTFNNPNYEKQPE